MLAIVYLFVMIALGDAICRRFYAFVSLPHRFAVAFLSGLLISSWWTYGAAWLFSGYSSPMLWGNLVYFITAIGVILWLRQMPQADEPRIGVDLGRTEFERWDWVVVGAIFLFVCWMMFATFDMTDGRLQIAHHQWSDFGSNVSIMQSFALGSNFPTEYPHYSGEHIHYHFLFYFQAGNLEYLGLSPSTSNDVLSVLSMVSMLILVMTLGVVLFASRLIGRIAAVIFFFHGSLSFIPFLYSHGLSNAWSAISSSRDFLPSVFPYRGELWGVWSQVVFINQRHLASSVGIFLVVLIFLLLKYREVPESSVPLMGLFTKWRRTPSDTKAAKKKKKQAKPSKAASGLEGASAKESTPDIGDIQQFRVKSDRAATGTDDDEAPAVIAPKKSAAKPRKAKEVKEPKETEAAKVAVPVVPTEPVEPKEPTAPWLGESSRRILPFIFCGVLLGLMPMWNGAVFTAAGAVLVLLLLLFPLRMQMFILGVTAAIVALPQLIYLRTGNIAPSPPLFHWGYTIDDPGIFNVLYYLLFTFGFKWLLIAIALVVAKSFPRKFFVAICVLIAVAFCMEFSEEVLANHKFLNVWLILANVFAAYGLWYIWKLEYWKKLFVGPILAVILTVLITLGGVIDLFPIHNSFWMEMGFTDDPLVKWVTEKTDPKAVFLSYHYVNHRILLAGRRLYFGHPYYAWSAGYPTFDRDVTYRHMFEETNPQELLRLLKANNISYVAIDNQLRNGDVTKNLNEAVYAAYFPKVFDDTENKYENLKIYQITDALGTPTPGAELPPGATPLPPGSVPGANAFNAGSGNGPGQLSKPRGLASDAKGNIFIADLGNARIEKYDADGKFLLTFGTSGDGEGQFKEPNGVAVDAAGNVWVVDAGGDKSKLAKFTGEGKFINEWKGPEGNAFYGPRDLAIGPNKMIYIVDQGRTRIVKFDPTAETFTDWGSEGAGEGQFKESTGITIVGNQVVVADAGNDRIQVFDLDGKFIRQWKVPLWQFEVDVWHYPDAVYDEQAKKLYVTSGWTNEVVAYDLEGNLLQGGFKPEGDADKLDNPSAIVISDVNKKRRLLVLNTTGCKVSAFELAAAAAKPAK